MKENFFKTNREIAEIAKKMKDYHGEDEIVSSHEMKSMIDDMPEVKVLKTGFNIVDSYIEGFEGGNLIAISGPRKSGKTLFSQTLTHNFLKQRIKSLWLSYELTNREFMRRFGENVPYFLMPRKMQMFSVDWVWTKILESVQKQNIQVIFIDHLHYLIDISRIKNISLEVGTVIRALKFLSIQTNTIIFLMCHTTKLDGVAEPGDKDIRDSSFVSQESDVGFMIWRDAKEQNVSWVKICYSRRTGCFDQKVKFYKNFNTGLLHPDNDLP
jgi:predicted ATP-dependent serine protease